jgi:hypothetical protein
MKTQLFTSTVFAFLFATMLQAQDITTVNAKSSDISDNLDLRAVASLFGDSNNLEDFERRLNDPKNQISNLDLNGDGQVDYLRVIESVERNTHLIIIQSVLEKDVFQDVATVEVEKDNNGEVQVQVVGDVYMYGQNYIYEPVYIHRPVIYSAFWAGSYSPYYSPWYWGYYPVYYTPWRPFPIYTYRRHIHNHINVHHHYNYVNVRRSERAAALYSTRRSDGYERLHPNRSFTQRNNVANRYELDKTRDINPSTRNNKGAGTTRNSSIVNGKADNPSTVRTTTRNSSVTKGNATDKSPTVRSTTRSTSVTQPTTRNATRTEKSETPKTSQTPVIRETPTRVTTRNSEKPTSVIRSNERQSQPSVNRQQSVTPKSTTVRSERPVPAQRQQIPSGNSQRGNSRSGDSRR